MDNDNFVFGELTACFKPCGYAKRLVKR